MKALEDWKLNELKWNMELYSEKFDSIICCYLPDINRLVLTFCCPEYKGSCNVTIINDLEMVYGIQDDIFDSCNGLVKKQVDMLEEYANWGIVSKEYMMPVIGMANRVVESYLNYLSLEYDLVLSRMQFHHKLLKTVNDITPKLMKTYLESLKPFKTFSF